jgi:DNA-binding transcriptional LysR family regulator
VAILRPAQPEPLASTQLAAFVAAVDAGSIGGAADSLSLTQSAATKRIQRLEARLGLSLLERCASGVKPTDAGQALYPVACEALVVLARAEHTVESRTDQGAETLCIGASHTVGEFVLPKLLAAFYRTAPEVRSQLEVRNTDGAVKALQEHEVEVSFIADGGAFPRLASMTIGYDELVVVVGSKHAWAGATTVRVEDLATEPFFTREEGSTTRARSLLAARQLGTELTPSLQATSTQTLKRLVQTNHGFTILSSLAVQDELLAGSLHALRLEGAEFRRPLRALRCRDEVPTAGAAALWLWLSRRLPLEL